MPRRAIHLQDLEGLVHIHERGYVLDRTDIHLAARQERNGAVEVDGEAALDAVEDHAFDLLTRIEFLLKLGPAILAPCLFAAQNRFAGRIFDALDINFDLVANLDGGRSCRGTEFLKRHAAFGFEANVDNR